MPISSQSCLKIAPKSRNATTERPYISVVIPTLNEEGVVDRLLGDLLQDATAKLEIIVADNGSTDRTPRIVEALARSQPDRIRLVQAPVKGVSSARNAGAKHARGQYLVFLDADARISPRTLLDATAEMQQRGLSTAAFRFISGSDCWGDRLIARLFNMGMGLLQHVAPTAPGSAGYLVLRDVHERQGGFNENMHFGEDVEYLRRASDGTRFRLLKRGRIMLDMRRFHSEGRLRLLWKMVFGTVIQSVKPVLINPPFEYAANHSGNDPAERLHTNAHLPRVLANSYKIVARWPRLVPAELASPSHFFKRADGQTDIVKLLNERGAHITPYCLDDHRRRLLLVETPETVDLLTADPFFYEAQRDHAIRIHAVAYGDLERLVDALLPAEQTPRPIFLHSTGRCGSTLLSQLLATTGNVQSISEPDFYSQAVLLSRMAEGRRDEELRALMDRCTRLLGHHLRCRDPKMTQPLIKLRSWCLFAAPLFEPLSVRGDHVFLYRDPLPTINSFLNAYFSERQYRIWRRLGLDRLLLSTLGSIPHTRKALGATVPLFNHPEFHRHGRASAVAYFTLQWLSHMAESARLQRTAPPFFNAIIRYEELLKDPGPCISTLFSELGYPVTGLEPNAIADLLARNSQQGSRMQSKGQYLLSEREEQQVLALLERRPIGWYEEGTTSPVAYKGGVSHAQTNLT